MTGPVRQSRRNRQTGTRVEVCDTHHPESPVADDHDGNRWATLCVDHTCYATHPTAELAMGWAAEPSVWCAGCAAIIRPVNGG